MCFKVHYFDHLDFSRKNRATLKLNLKQLEIMPWVFFAKEVKGPMLGQELTRGSQKFQRGQYPAAELHV